MRIHKEGIIIILVLFLVISSFNLLYLLGGSQFVDSIHFGHCIHSLSAICGLVFSESVQIRNSR